jgi:aspartyl-tRNA(Asn)/glutamyl-tRNA(Gln) amidotransferase subunit A
MSPDNPVMLSASDLLTNYARRMLSPIEVLQAVNERIARLNPGINAFACLNPAAETAAQESEARWRIGRPIGPLDGVPCTVKDLLDIAGLPTRRGSRLTDGAAATDDAPLVLSLKAAGAVIIGKTTTTEYGWKSPGDCPLHGITRNPWNTRHTTGGSSAGAGAAAAAAFGPLHVGTDAGGSVRIPAAWCGVVGLKPTFGRIPLWPASAFAPVAVAGPITRTVRDTALLLSVLARRDVRDPYCLPDEARDWTADIEDGVAGLRIGLLQRPGFDAPLDRANAAAFEQAAATLAEAGAMLEEVDPDLPDVREIHPRIFGAALTRLVNSFPETRRHMLDPGLLFVAARAGNASAADMMEFEALRLAAANVMARLHLQYDLVLLPCVPVLAPLADGAQGDPFEAMWTQWAPWTALFNHTRQPAISMPMGFAPSGLPCSVQVAGPLYRDDLVLRAARVLEQARPVAIPDLQ